MHFNLILFKKISNFIEYRFLFPFYSQNKLCSLIFRTSKWSGTIRYWVGSALLARCFQVVFENPCSCFFYSVPASICWLHICYYLIDVNFGVNLHDLQTSTSILPLPAIQRSFIIFLTFFLWNFLIIDTDIHFKRPVRLDHYICWLWFHLEDFSDVQDMMIAGLISDV